MINDYLRISKLKIPSCKFHFVNLASDSQNPPRLVSGDTHEAPSPNSLTHATLLLNSTSNKTC